MGGERRNVRRVRYVKWIKKNNKGPQLFKISTIEMDKMKQHNNHQQLAREDVLVPKLVTLDTSHWLISALNAVATKKAVVFGRRKKKGKTGKICEMDQKKQQRTTTI